MKRKSLVRLTLDIITCTVRSYCELKNFLLSDERKRKAIKKKLYINLGHAV